MPTTSPLAPKILKGAFIRLDDTGIVPVPQIIVFQYNSETIVRKLKPYEKPTDKEGNKPDPNAQAAPYDPEEEVDLALDATDALEEPEKNPIAVVSGIADRIAALEMLLYPSDEVGLLSSAVGALAGLVGLGAGATSARRESPVVLLAWGPGRVVPIKLTSFTVEEQAFNPALYPIRAKVTVGLKVLTDDFFESRAAGRELTAAEEMARGAYRYSRTQKRILAAKSTVNSLDSVLSMLPF